MCQQCYDLKAKYYPDLTDGDYGELLMGATAFPFSTPERVEQQLIELRAKTDGTLHGALTHADEELSQAWEAGRAEREKWEADRAEREKWEADQ